MPGLPPRLNTIPTDQESKQGLKDKIEHPNYASWQTRTGLGPWFVNDTKGNEFILAQHRSGTHWEMTSTGAFKLVASKNREDITFGKQISYTTGANDSTIDGDSSVKTKGSRRITTDGNSEMTTKGKMAMSMKNLSILAGEFVDIAGQAFTAKTKSIVMQATDGPIALNAVGNAGLSSDEGSVGLYATTGAVTMEAGWKVSVKGKEVHINGGGGEIVMKDGKCYINCGLYQAPKDVWIGREAGPTYVESSTGDR